MTVSRMPRGFLGKGLATFYNFITGGPNFINDYESVTTGASDKAANLNIYQTKVTSGGTAGNENLTLGNGSGAIVGQRKLITLVTRTNASDVVVLDKANMVKSDGTTQPTTASLDAANEFVQVKWNGLKWQVEHFSSGSIT